MKVVAVNQIVVPLSVKVDPYIPLAVKTYEGAIGAIFLRIGNFQTSLIEIPIDPKTGIVRGIKLVSFNKVSERRKLIIYNHYDGLPEVSLDEFVNGGFVSPEDDFRYGRFVEYRIEFVVYTMSNRIIIDWSDKNVIDSEYTYRGLSFFCGDGSLLGASIELSDEQMSLFQEHIFRELPMEDDNPTFLT